MIFFVFNYFAAVFVSSECQLPNTIYANIEIMFRKISDTIAKTFRYQAAYSAFEKPYFAVPASWDRTLLALCIIYLTQSFQYFRVFDMHT